MSDSKLRWRTQEGFGFELPLAAVSTRCLAWLVDAAVIGIGMQILSLLLAILVPALPGVAAGAQTLLSFVVFLLYAATLEWFWQGQTVGKRALGIRVMDARGLPLAGSQILMRNLLRVVDTLPLIYLVGGASCMFTRRGQRVGDAVAGTVVVARHDAAALRLPAIAPSKYNSLLEFPLQAMKLRECMTPDAAALVVEALSRRDDLDATARAAVFGRLRAHIGSLAQFPGEATADLSDEQFLRDVAGVLFRDVK